MAKLILNAGYGVQFEGDYHNNGHPKTIARTHYKEDANGADSGFSERVNIVQEMVDLWNAKHATT